MNRATYWVALVFIFTTFIAGCSITDRNSISNFTSAKPPYKGMDEAIYIPYLVAATACSPSDLKFDVKDNKNIATYRNDIDNCIFGSNTARLPEEIDYAISTAIFNAAYLSRADDEGRIARNRVQDTLLTMAEQNCGNFMHELAQAGSVEESASGVIGLISGGLGGLLTETDAARSLAATSGAASGSGAIISKAMFKKEISKVITSGINIKHYHLSLEIEGKQKKSLKEYSLDNAIKDAIRYSDACNAMEGLRKVSDSIAVNGANADASGGGTPTVSVTTRQVGRINALTTARLQVLTKIDEPRWKDVPTKDRLPSLINWQEPLDTQINALKSYYKSAAIAADPVQQDKLEALLNEAETP
jgi:hypothetical protein